LDFKEFHQSRISSDRHPWEQARVEVIIKLIMEFVPYHKPAHVLEIGCGDVFVLEALAKNFPHWSFVGTDVAFPDSFLTSYRHTRINVYKNSEEAINNIKQHIDLVLLLDVVEHSHDDLQFLKEIIHFNNIDNKTLFIVTVPSFQWLFCSHDAFLEHYRRYSNNSLSALFSQVGLKTIAIGYFFGSLLFPRMLRVSLEKFNLIKPSQGLRNWRYPSLTSLVRLILVQDFKFTSAIKKIGIKIPGLSNYAVCRKSE
jgi:hypothetical protein